MGGKGPAAGVQRKSHDLEDAKNSFQGTLAAGKCVQTELSEEAGSRSEPLRGRRVVKHQGYGVG